MTDSTMNVSDIPLLQFHNVGRIFPPHTVALRSVSCSVYSGESVAIVGASGSGKSTMLSIMGLLDRPSIGSYLFQGIEVSNLTAGRRCRLRRDYIGFIFQSFHLIEHLTVKENVCYALAIKGIRGEQACYAAALGLSKVGLMDKADAFPGQLSGGERQRAAIARATAHEPRLLLCDEPTGNLDSANSKRVVELLHHVVSPDTALIVVTHDMSVASSCHRQLRMIDGTVSEVTT
ncbi:MULTISPECIES: ABC transporter ATP-binding protein [unclassified Bifidobacterium]|uniref:ABC transporter ATP-binding protein n=1 Tax=unclassified Bifidobacterium TaxID=2608897 RepID=UPI0015E2A932|nr:MULTISPECIES: ABC transporter ATP-binding protein [unclassified Bifidobacterium]